MKSLKRLRRGFSLLPSLLTLYLRFFLDRLLGKRRILWEIQLPAQTAYVKEVLAALDERREISLSFLPPLPPIPDLPPPRPPPTLPGPPPPPNPPQLCPLLVPPLRPLHLPLPVHPGHPPPGP